MSVVVFKTSSPLSVSLLNHVSDYLLERSGLPLSLGGLRSVRGGSTAAFERLMPPRVSSILALSGSSGVELPRTFLGESARLH